MQNKNLSNAVAVASGGAEFVSYGDVANESDYNNNVVFVDAAQKPSWSAVQSNLPTQQWREVRSARNSKLSNSDWTQLQDVPITDAKREEWQVYRQSLRDITTQANPATVSWPTPPE